MIDPTFAAALAMGILAWWLGATGARVRREVTRLDEGRLDDADYVLVSRFRRLRDDPVALALRIRISRYLAAVFLPLALGVAGMTLGWFWGFSGILLGWLAAAGAESAGGGAWATRLGRLRAGAGFAAWSRVTAPAARLVRPLAVLRRPADPAVGAEAMVLAESRATLLPAGRLGRTERRFLRKLLASTSILVADILVKWESVDWIALDTPRDAAVERVRGSGRSRLPVLDGNRVVGLVTAKDLLLGLHRPGSTGAPRDLMRPVYFVREEETVKALLGELQEARTHLAVVLDRLGRPVGIVTMEDVLEEIVGELHDEREREATP